MSKERKYKHLADIFPSGFQIEKEHRTDPDSIDDEALSEIFQCEVKQYDYKATQKTMMSGVIWECYHKDISLHDLEQMTGIAVQTMIDMLNCDVDLDLMSISKFEVALGVQLIHIAPNPEDEHSNPY